MSDVVPELQSDLASKFLVYLLDTARYDQQMVVSYARLFHVGDLGRDVEYPADIRIEFNDALVGLFDVGVARSAQPIPVEASPEEIGATASLTWNAIEESPLPSKEWTGLSETLDDLLPGLVGVSPSSVSRYRSGQRPTPDAVADRLHTIALIITDLAGSYNDFGIRRWFTRPRKQLDGRAPADILTGEWDPNSEDVRRVRDLAGWLTGQLTNDSVSAR